MSALHERGRVPAGFVFEYQRHWMAQHVRLGKLLLNKRPVCQLMDRRSVQRWRSKSRIVRFSEECSRFRPTFKWPPYPPQCRRMRFYWTQGAQSGCDKPHGDLTDDARCTYWNNVSFRQLVYLPGHVLVFSCTHGVHCESYSGAASSILLGIELVAPFRRR